MRGEIIRLWTDHRAVGCGERVFVVLAVGPKWAELYHCATMTPFKVDAQQLRHAIFLPDARPRVLLRQIRERRAVYRAARREYSKIACREARDLLKARIT